MKSTKQLEYTFPTIIATLSFLLTPPFISIAIVLTCTITVFVEFLDDKERITEKLNEALKSRRIKNLDLLYATLWYTICSNKISKCDRDVLYLIRLAAELDGLHKPSDKYCGDTFKGLMFIFTQFATQYAGGCKLERKVLVMRKAVAYMQLLVQTPTSILPKYEEDINEFIKKYKEER